MDVTSTDFTPLLEKLNRNRTPSPLTIGIEDPERFNVASRPAKVFQTQWKSLFEPLVIPDFLSPQEVDLLVKGWHHNTSKAAHDKAGVSEKKLGWNELEKSMLQERLENLFGRFNAVSGSYHTIGFPYTPHADLGKDPKLFPCANLLMPLQLDPPGKETHLVLFHQRYFGYAANFCAAPRTKPHGTFYNQNILEYSGVLGLRQNGLSEDERQRWLDHCIPGDLEGFSISHLIPWKIGSLIVFDPTHIHASENFLDQGISRKLALTISLGHYFSE